MAATNTPALLLLLGRRHKAVVEREKARVIELERIAQEFVAARTKAGTVSATIRATAADSSAPFAAVDGYGTHKWRGCPPGTHPHDHAWFAQPQPCAKWLAGWLRACHGLAEARGGPWVCLRWTAGPTERPGWFSRGGCAGFAAAAAHKLAGRGGSCSSP